MFNIKVYGMDIEETVLKPWVSIRALRGLPSPTQSAVAHPTGAVAVARMYFMRSVVRLRSYVLRSVGGCERVRAILLRSRCSCGPGLEFYCPQGARKVPARCLQGARKVLTI